MTFEETPENENLALLVAHRKGYVVTKYMDEEGNEISYYTAENSENTFFADSFISLLGLIELGETRKTSWRLDAKEAAYTSLVKDKMYGEDVNE
ncbi:hypothetical protein [Chamaesiphon sp. VAR_48_metabat_403]|uniref:hypothetical protein n=1 Tax=Chamaesiphon sp. VAR_48_metabat_403 TaxID=2964700 RepID=UPI00286E05E0|nr:hypothetical protein [Chamaesiphon sp. VAR_48_metabat_403]